ncbi:MAG: hypothetical protein IT186_12360 [Acidobacteria bacterium]|nr:hypothetical protein [Acidobacteriota bacterium]
MPLSIVDSEEFGIDLAASPTEIRFEDKSEAALSLDSAPPASNYGLEGIDEVVDVFVYGRAFFGGEFKDCSYAIAGGELAEAERAPLFGTEEIVKCPLLGIAVSAALGTEGNGRACSH